VYVNYDYGIRKATKQLEYQLWLRGNRFALSELRRVANMNETQNGWGLLDVWLIWTKLREKDGKLLKRLGQLTGCVGENASDETETVLTGLPCTVCALASEDQKGHTAHNCCLFPEFFRP
jgi:hypothetical protein